MPHLLIERLRTFPEVCNLEVRKREECPVGAYAIEIADIVAGVIFVVGSACFLPKYSQHLDIFLLGCALFIIGSVIYVFICTYALMEAVLEKGWNSFEAWENTLYTVGSWVFLAGTVLYWPEKAKWEYMELIKQYSLGQYFEMFSEELEGTLLFIVGSMMFAAAAFTNALNQRKYNDDASRLLTAVTSLYFAGSTLFIMGSIAFLPDLGCNEKMVSIGAWLFIVGSVFFTLGSVLSLCRTIQILGFGDFGERTPVRESAEKALT
eukprot:TRINITY_DN23571_c0_g4_i2.p1 TRINITY_DN23571_c0_g4~~TRINITY_DN23571_c0_g4_i2.p1  ORF type:complete len:264 (-),score=72.11 TRINITY_DN23571_c0_g4_i2:161-952(-)